MMDRFFWLAPVLVVVLCGAVCPSALAAEDVDVMDADVVSGDVSTETFTADTSGGGLIVNVTVPAVEDVPASPELSADVSPSYPAYSTRSLDDVSAPDDADSMSGLLTSMFGTYSPRTQTVTEHLSDGSTVTYTEVVPGLAGLDWPWIASVALFFMSLYCIFRMIGGLLRWN